MVIDLKILHNAGVRTLVRVFLGLIFLGSLALVGYILFGPRGNNTWSALAGALAVITAVIAAYPAIRVLEIQQDALRPRPIPYFDMASRYGILQLRVKNFGSGVAYDVRLQWNNRPVDHEGKEIASLDHISVLLPQESASLLVGASSTQVKKFGKSQFEGECCCRDANGGVYRDKFICSVDGSQRQLVHDDEMPKTLYELQKVPEGLDRIADFLERKKSSE